MNTHDKIDKAANELVKSVNEFTIQSLIKAQRDGQLKLENEQLDAVATLVQQLSSAGYHKHLRAFQESITRVVPE